MGVKLLGSIFIPDNMREELKKKWIKLHPLDSHKKFSQIVREIIRDFIENKEV